MIRKIVIDEVLHTVRALGVERHGWIAVTVALPNGRAYAQHQIPAGFVKNTDGHQLVKTSGHIYRHHMGV